MSNFWMGFTLGIVSTFASALIIGMWKGSYLMVKSQKFYSEVMRRKNKRSDKLIMRQNDKRTNKKA